MIISIIVEKIQIEVFQNKSEAFNHYVFQPSCRLSEIHNSSPLQFLKLLLNKLHWKKWEIYFTFSFVQVDKHVIFFFF